MSPYELRGISKVYLGGGETIVKAVYCASLNQFLLVDGGGGLHLADGNGEVIFGPINLGSVDSDVRIDYSNFHNCLVAWNGQKLNIRRDLGGNWLLQTTLANKPDITENAAVDVELTVNEAVKLLQYLRSPAIKFDCTNEDTLKEIIGDLQSKVDNAKEAEKSTRGHKWTSILLRGPYNFLLASLTSALTELKQTGLRLSILPVISAVIERLNILKDNAYVFELNGDPSSVDKSIMASEAARRLTFRHWPHMDYKWALPDQMAEAGFFHQPNSAGDDRVFCFTCTVCLVCWEPADEPWSEHERHAPSCPFIKGEYTQNVPISSVYASSSALSHDCADEIACVSKSSCCDLIASSTRNGEVVLWNIAKELKKSSPIRLDPSEPFIEMKTGYRCRPRRHFKSGVAWADEAELLSHDTALSPTNVCSDHLHDALELGNNEIASEIVAVCPQKDDFVVTTVCTCAQPDVKRPTSEILDPHTNCAAALIVGCGIIDSKLRSEHRISETSSSPSSFVENLNTVNKATSGFNECIIPCSDSPSCSSLDGQQTPACSSAIRYRPFILVYKVEEAETDESRIICSKSRRVGAVAAQSTASDKNVLASVKEMDESLSIAGDYDEIDNGIDDKNGFMDAGEGANEESNKENDSEMNSGPFAIEVFSPSAGLPNDLVVDAFNELQHKFQGTTSGVQVTNSSVTGISSSSGAGGPSVVSGPGDSFASTASMKTAYGYDTTMSKTPPSILPTDQMIITVAAKPFNASVAILQCLRMPTQLDSPLYYIHGIVPSPDGSAVLVVVNKCDDSWASEKDATTGTTISTILVYRLSFSCHLASLSEQPHRQISFDADVGLIENVLQLQSSIVSEGDAIPNLVAVLTKSGEVRVVNVDTGTTVAKSVPPLGRKYTAICAFQDDKLCVCCDDGSVSTLELLRTDFVAEDSDSLNPLAVDDSLEWKDPDLLVNKPLSLDVLKELWYLTRSDWATAGQFNVQAWGPSSWVEVQQHQRLRKNPQHYLREEKLAKSWHLIPDSDSWREHIFELSLPANFLASHVDFRFTLQQSAVAGMPPIQVTFLRLLPTVGSRSTSVARERFAGWEIAASSSLSDFPGPSVSTFESEENLLLKNHVLDKNFLDDLHAEVVAGPFDLHAALDLFDSNGLIQFSPPQFNNAKIRTFLIHVQALTKNGADSSKLKPEAKKSIHKASSSSGLSSMEKPASGFGGLYQQKYGSNKAGIPAGKGSAAGNVRVLPSKSSSDFRKNEDLKGCDWIQEISVTVWRSRKTALKKERKQRLAITKNVDFVAKLVKNLDSVAPETRGPLDIDTLYYQQYLILDLLTWVNHQSTFEDRRILETLARAVEAHVEGLFRSCYVFGNRSISRKFTALMADLLMKLKSSDVARYTSFITKIKETVRHFVLSVNSYRSSGSPVWLLALAEEVYKLSPIGSSSFVSELQQFCCFVGNMLKQRVDEHRRDCSKGHGLSGFPFELEMFELPPPVLSLLQRSQQPFTYANVTSAGTSLIANITSDSAYDDNDWLEIAGIDYTPPGGAATKAQRKVRTIRLERDHIYGLIEVEPLHFICYSASDGIRIENLETGVSISVSAAANSVPTSTGAGPIPLPDMSQYEQSGNPALTSAVTSMKQQVQNILNKQMQLLAIQQQKQKLQVKLTDHVEKLASLAAEQIPATQASSASTFGVPTTPKTTPFMTPTPLSPHLSPINSEVDLHFDDANVDVVERIYANNRSEGCPKLVPTEFLKPPPAQALVVDRMTSGARKFVVLSFERPILLTDMIVPQCGDIGSLSVDVWLKSESDDGQRLIVCNDISQKTLVLCDLQPPCLCQYLKITYIGRQGLGSCTSKIPLGNFYGYTYSSSLQLAIVGSGRTFEDVRSLCRPCLSIEQLRQVEEDVECRYGLACDLLRNLLKSPEASSSVECGSHEKSADALMVREVCREIWSIRMQWNLIHRAIERMRSTIVVTDPSENIGYDKARVISEMLLTALLRISPLMKLDLEYESACIFNPDARMMLPLDTAVDLFEHFCISGVSYLTALSVMWILHHGSYTNWWGKFFGVVIDKFFAMEEDVERTQKVFLILSYLVDRGLAAGNTTVFVEMLNQLNSQLSEGITSNNGRRVFQVTLMLLSHCFDCYPLARVLTSRWDFLLGEFSKRRHSSPKADADNFTSHRNTKVFGIYKDPANKSEDLISQHHQKVMQLSSELKEYVKNKSVKQPAFAKPKIPAYGQMSSSPYLTFPGGTKSGDHRTSTSGVSTNAAEGTSNSSSQKKHRLKLPYELCRSVARKLAPPVLRCENLCSAETYILVCKVLSSVCRCSRPLLHISDVFPEPGQVNQLVRTLVTSKNIYVRRALTCLIQDFLIAESKCGDSRSSSSNGGNATSVQITAPPVGTESSGNSVESELDVRTSGQQNPVAAIGDLLKVNNANENLPVASAKSDDKDVGAESSTAANDFEVQWGLPKSVSTPAGAQAYIEYWTETIKLLPVPTCKINSDKRRQRLKEIYRELLYIHATKFGLTLLQDTKGCSNYAEMLTQSEADLAKIAQSDAQYDAGMDKISTTFLAPTAGETSDLLGFGPVETGSLPESLDGNLEGPLLESTKSVASVVGPPITLQPLQWVTATVQAGPSGFTSIAPSQVVPAVQQAWNNYFTASLPPPVSGQNLAEAKDALWKLCQQLNASTSKVSGVYMQLSDVPPPPPPPALSSMNTTTSINLDLGFGSTAQSSAAAVADGALFWDDDSDSEGTPMEQDSTAPTFSATTNTNHSYTAPAHLWKVQESYSGFKRPDPVTVDVAASQNLEHVQPISLALDERLESQLGWQAEISIRRWLLINSGALHSSLQAAKPFVKPTGSSLLQQREHRASHVHLSSSAAMSNAFNDLFDLLAPPVSPAFVENLLDSCWLLSVGNDTKNQELPFVATVRAINLGENAVKKLMSWLLDGVGVSEKIWCLSLRILASSVRVRNPEFVQLVSPSTGPSLVDDSNFPKVLRRLLTRTHRSGSSDVAGPDIVQPFIDLLTCVHLHNANRQSADRFREILVQLLTELLSERDFRAIAQLPLDLLNKMVEFLLNQNGVWQMEQQLVADYTYALSTNVMDYLLTVDSSTEVLLTNGTANPRFCFFVGRPELATNEFRCFLDRLDVAMVNLLKLAHKLLNCTGIVSSSSGGTVPTTYRASECLTDDAKAGASALGGCLAEAVLDLKPSLVAVLLNAIGLCHGGGYSGEGGLDMRDLCNAIPVTAADSIVQILFTLMMKATGSRLANFLTVAVNFLDSAHENCNQAYISNLSVCVFLRIVDVCAVRSDRAIVDTRLVAVLAQQLVRCCETVVPVPSIDHSHLLKSAAAVCGRGPKSSDLATKKLSDAKVDGMTNFAPMCSIASSSPMAHHLTALLNSAPPHRRARNAAWSYHFYPAESWLDMTLALPYAIILKEIQIRPHVASLQSCPSAVQVELSPDSNEHSLRGFSPPTATAGYTNIRIAVDPSLSPVRMVRLHFKRPLDSSTLGMSQILLLGHTTLSTELSFEDPRLQWLHLFHYALNLSPPRAFFRAANGLLCTELSHKLVEMFLCVPLNASAYGQLIDVFALLETHSGQAGAEAPFTWLLRRVGMNDCFYRPQALVWLAELMSRLCSVGSGQPDRAKISKLIQWITEALEAHSAACRTVAVSMMRCLIWCCSCILWHWKIDGRSALIRPDLVRLLFKFARDSNDTELGTACGYLLCSVLRAYPEYLDSVLQLCGLGNFSSSTDDRKIVASDADRSHLVRAADLRVLSLVSRCGSIVRPLESRGALTYLINILTGMCIEGNKNCELIVAIVELMKEVSIEPFIKNWLTTPTGSLFWVPLLSYLCLSRWRLSASKGEWRRLESATISLIRRVVTCHGEGQRLISKLIGQLLMDTSGGLNGSIQQIILRVLLEDETLTVVTEDSRVVRNDLQILHPQYGCGIHTVVREISVYATCAQLLPDTTSRKSLKNAKKVSYGASSEFQDPVSFYGGDFTLEDFLYDGEKAKTKRLATKPGQGNAKTESSWKPKSGSTTVFPVAFMSHERFGVLNPLPGKLTVAQLYKKLLSSGTDKGFLHLTIRYGLPSELISTVNDGLLQSASSQSTLEVFARQGGLALLAEHLQLYQPTVGAQNAGGNIGLYNENDWKMLDEMQSSANKPFLNEPEMMDYYEPSYEWVNVASGGSEPSVIDPKGNLAGRMRGVVSVGLSPHVVVCFGVFLRVTGYADLLVTKDRRQAQWLLRLAMGVTKDASGVNIVNHSEASSMGTLPFEILASLYWANSWDTDEGRLIRTASLELGIPQLLLRCLTVFSHQNERRPASTEEKPEVVRIVDHLLAALTGSDTQPNGAQPSAEEKPHLYWAKGTGFGTGSTQQHWNVDLHIIKQKQDEQSVACLLKVLAQFIYPGEVPDSRPFADDGPSTSASTSNGLSLNFLPPWWPSFSRLIFDSCMVPTLQCYLRNDSVLDISRHVSVYESVMRLLCSLALVPQLCDLLTELGDRQQSLKSLLSKLKDCVDIYISKLEPLRKTGESVGSEDAATEEGLLKLVPLIERTSSLVQRYKSDAEEAGLRGHRRSAGSTSLDTLSNEEKYIRAMKPLQFDSFKFLRDGNGEIRFAVSYHYEASVQGATKDMNALAPCVRRLAQEAVTLSTSLPLSYNSSVFVRTADERLDIMKVLITGPSDTPYANGCFEFDVWFPTDYPNGPMHINLQTTGGSTVRFNPNLYNDGKVCLSILNTWHGRPEERWNAQTSSFLQVLVSIQSLILVPDPYFNEPGYERSRGTPAGQHASREYDANIRQATVRWGMLEMLRNPPSCFKEVIQHHFWIKRDEIIKQVEDWITELDGSSSGSVDKRVQRNLGSHLASLKKHFTALKEELAKMSCPVGFEDQSPPGSSI